MAYTEPEWLTNDFFQSCLESAEGTSHKIKVTSHTIEPAVAAGNNYGSMMLRAKVNYKIANDSKEHFLSLIVKAPLNWEGMLSTEMVSGFAAVEPKFYNEYIPKTKQMSKHNLVPKHYVSPNPICVVMEDLKASGYDMVDRHNMLDFDHCQLYVKASAKLHALSIAVYRADPELVKTIAPEESELIKQTDAIIKSMTNFSFRCMIAWLEDHPGYNKCLEVFKAGLENDTLYNITKEVDKFDKALKVVSQGDPWCTNMMFRYDSSGKPVEIKLLDFQFLKYCSPIQELATFLAAGPNIEVRKSRLNELHSLYVESLNSNLEELGCPERLSMEDFKKEVITLAPWTLMMICFMLPFALSDEPADMKEYLHPSNVPIRESPVYKLFSGKTFNKYCPDILQLLVRDGVFDIVQEEINKRKI